jgi:hypothetical protein
MATESDLKKKRKYFEEQRMTSHWPHKIKVFAKTPRTYGNILPIDCLGHIFKKSPQ